MDRIADFPLFEYSETSPVTGEILPAPKLRVPPARHRVRIRVRRRNSSEQQPLLLLDVDEIRPAPAPIEPPSETSQQPVKILRKRADNAGRRPLPQLKPDTSDAAPTPERRPATFQDLVDLAASRTDRSEQQRRVTAAQLRTMAWILATKQARAAGRLTPVSRREVVLVSIPCDAGWINDHLPHYSRGVFRMTRQSFGNALGACRKEMAKAGLIAPPTRPRLPEDSAWGRLFADLDKAHLERTKPKQDLKKTNGARTKKRPEDYGSMNLRTLGVWCHFQGIQFSEMSDDVVDRFATYLRHNQLREDIPGYIRGAVNLWNKAVTSGLAGPVARLLTVTRGKPTYTLATVNPAFDAEVRALEALMTGGPRKGPRRRSEPAKLKPETIRMYLYRIRQAVTAHDRHAPDRASIRLAHLFQPETFDDILAFFYDRTRTVVAARTGEDLGKLPEQVGVTPQTSGIANALMWVARHYLKLSPADIDQLRDRARAYHPKKPDDLNPKVRARLDRLAVPVVQARLLHLPWRLMRLAAESKDDSLEDAARMAMVAAAVVIELYCPLRLTNLAELRFGHNLVYDMGGKRIEKLLVPLHQTKNGKLYEWPLDRDASQLVQSFIRDYRPILMTGENDWLFPADCGLDAPRSNNALSAAITGMIDAHVGAEVNVHLFRSFAACLLLEHSPGALNDVRLLLGHQSFDTTLKHYAYLRPKIVAVRHASAIREARHELDPLVRDWFPGKWR